MSNGESDASSRTHVPDGRSTAPRRCRAAHRSAEQVLPAAARPDTAGRPVARCDGDRCRTGTTNSRATGDGHPRAGSHGRSSVEGDSDSFGSSGRTKSRCGSDADAANPRSSAASVAAHTGARTGAVAGGRPAHRRQSDSRAEPAARARGTERPVEGDSAAVPDATPARRRRRDRLPRADAVVPGRTADLVPASD